MLNMNRNMPYWCSFNHVLFTPAGS